MYGANNKVSQSYNNVHFFPFSKSVRRLSTWRVDGKHHWCGALVSSQKSSLRGSESIKPCYEVVNKKISLL